MARASIPTLLPLDRFAAIIGIHPLHFNQIQVDELAPPQVCGMPFVQHSWQAADRIGREELAQAIADAEYMFAREVGFWPAPKYIHNEVHTLKLNKFWMVRPVVKTDYGYFDSAGLQTTTLIFAGVAVVYSDVDGDGYSETATMVVPTTVTDPNEIHVYYPGKTAPGDEIRPITVSIVGGNATIICRRELLYLDDLAEVLNPRAFDGLDAANFLATVDVYRVYIDHSAQGIFKWFEPLCSLCNGVGCAACTVSTDELCTVMVDKRLGLLKTIVADYDLATDSFTEVCDLERNPDQLYINYLAGWPLDGRNMDREMELAITRLAVAQLDRPICACDHITAYVGHWREDLALRQGSQSGSVSYGFSQKVYDCPFGTTRGALYAWRVASKYKIGEPV